MSAHQRAWPSFKRHSTLTVECQTPYPRGKGYLHQPIRTQVLPCQNFQEDPYGRLFYH
jgi:hypothetical protein